MHDASILSNITVHIILYVCVYFISRAWYGGYIMVHGNIRLLDEHSNQEQSENFGPCDVRC